MDRIHPRVASYQSDDLIFCLPAGISWNLLLFVSSQGVCRKFRENRSVLVQVHCGAGPRTSLCYPLHLKSRSFLPFNCGLGRIEEDADIF